MVSRVAFGAWAAGGHGWGRVDDEQSIAAIRRAREVGIDFFDTADVYGFGHSEEILADALGEERHEVVIATKFGVTWDAQGRIARDVSAAYLRRALEGSLRRLRLRRIPLYQLHWPDGRTEIEEPMRELRRLQQEGLVENVGCSNLTPDLLARAAREVDVVSLQGDLSLLHDGFSSELRRVAAEHGVALLPYDVLRKGLLTGKFDAGARFGADDVRARDPEFAPERLAENLARVEVLREVGARHGKSAAQVAIRWVLQQPGVGAAIVGARSREQVTDNAGALGWSLTDADLRALDSVSARAKP